ncbi:MAG TPA: tetratricopeptide repeat protein [Vicinamibacterales bacterium]|nr:tetratricopeptide repeat protein [Vicinamibacterales bacterium]
MTTLRRALIAFLLVVGPAALAPAADREHQQIMAEIRMLQEQTQQLQLVVAALGETVRAITAKIDEQAGVTRKAFADQRVVLDSVADGIRILREKVDEANVRLSTLGQEVEALRTTPPPTAATGTEPGEPTGAPPSPPGVSPKQLFGMAYGDYAAGRWDLAIEGFENYLKTFPKSPLAHEAQLYIGQAHYAAGRFKEAVAAYDEVITGYPGTASVPQAFYKRGLAYERLGALDRARESLQFVLKNFPDTPEALLARQALERLDRPRR